MSLIRYIAMHFDGNVSEYSILAHQLSHTDDPDLDPIRHEGTYLDGHYHEVRQFTYRIDGKVYVIWIDPNNGLWGWEDTFDLIGHLDNRTLHIHVVDLDYMVELKKRETVADQV
jgi:hypothetical protein